MITYTTILDVSRDKWQSSGKLMGDFNPPHYEGPDGYASVRFPEPCSPSVCLLLEAEKIVRGDGKFKSPAVRITMNRPIFNGKYDLRVNHHSKYSEVSLGDNDAVFEFGEIPNRKDAITSLRGIQSLETMTRGIDEGDLEDFNKIYDTPDNKIVFTGFAYGRIIEAFFEKNSRIGALLSHIELYFINNPTLGNFRTNLRVKKNSRLLPVGNPNRRNTNYDIEGECYQDERLIASFEAGIFAQRENIERREIVIREPTQELTAQ